MNKHTRIDTLRTVGIKIALMVLAWCVVLAMLVNIHAARVQVAGDDFTKHGAPALPIAGDDFTIHIKIIVG